MTEGPFEDLGDEQITTFSCPRCNDHHNRLDYKATTRRLKLNGTLYRIYQCPGGHDVVLDMTVTLPKNPNEPVYIELDPA